MKAVVLTIGYEILSGHIVNSNSAWISQLLTERGIDVAQHLSVGDNIEIVAEKLRELSNEFDIIITTGGLGPTHDDCTKNSLCVLLGDTLVQDKLAENSLRKFLTERNRPITERQLLQSLIPSSSKSLANNFGLAPGIVSTYNETMIISLPGVPREMKGILTEHIEELLPMNGYISVKKITTAGIPESQLADVIGDISFVGDSSELAFLPSSNGVLLRITSKSTSKEKANNESERIVHYLQDRISPWIVSLEGKSLLETVTEELRRKHCTVSTAESCTGGMVAEQLTRLAGSSEYYYGSVVAYANSVKILDLSVPSELITTVGAVSEEVARVMAKSIRKRYNTDFGISLTGIAGPDGGSDEKPVGLVWIGISTRSAVYVEKHIFGKDRDTNRERATAAALWMLLKELRS